MSSQLRRSTRKDRRQKVITSADYGEWDNDNAVSEEDDGDQDFEVTPRSGGVRKKRKTSKKSKRSESSLKEPDDQERKDSEGLFGDLQQGAVKVCVANWMSSYANEPDDAITNLVNFIFQCCGSSAVVSIDDIQDRDREDVLAEVQECCVEDEKSFPINLKEKVAKRKTFKSRFGEFWLKLTKAMKNELLFDENLLPTILEWLAAIASAELRPLRMTATMATFQIVTGLVKIGSEFQNESARSEGFLEKEMKKKKKVKSKLKQFEDDVNEYKKKLDVVHNLMKICFNTVFVHRFRDVSEDIRKLCIDSLGEWMIGYPSGFLADVKLKYIGWCLNDKKVIVRRSSLTALHKLLLHAEFVDTLTDFIERFKDRILEMTRDKVDQVAVDAIKLATLMLKLNLLDDEDGSDIQSYIWDENASVRNASSEFVSQDVFEALDDEQSLEEEQQARLDLTEVVNIFANCVSQDSNQVRAQYLVNSLWVKVKSLHKWEIYVKLLLASEKKSNMDVDEESQLSENQKDILVQIMLASAQKAVNHLKIDETRRGRSKNVSIAQKDKDDKIREEMSSCFLQNLPELLTVFQADELKLDCLVQIIMYLNLSEMAAKRMKKQFLRLTKKLKSVFFKHNSEVVVNHVMEALNHFCMNDHLWKEGATRVVQAIATELANKFTSLSESESASASDSTLECLRRIYACSKQFHFPELEFSEEHERLLQSNCLSDGNEEIAKILLKICFCDFVWSLERAVQPNEDSEEDEVKKQEEHIADKRDSILKYLEYVMEHGSSELKPMAYSILCDVLTYSNCRTDATVDLIVDDALLSRCENFLLGIFGDDDSDSTDDDSKSAAQLNVLLGTCKLCLTRQVQFVKLAAIIVAQYTRYDQRIDEIIKFFMGQLKRKSSSILQSVQIKSLIHVYEVSTVKDVETLSKRLVLTHGLDHGQRSFVDFIKEGIAFGLKDAPKYSYFLSPALTSFVRRSTKQQKQQMLGAFLADQSVLPSPGEDLEDLEQEQWDVIYDFETMLRDAVGTAPKQKLELKEVSSSLLDKDGDGDAVMSENEQGQEQGGGDQGVSDSDVSMQVGELPGERAQDEEAEEASAKVRKAHKKKRGRRLAHADSEGWIKKSKAKNPRF